jgi:hypothetical protein
MKNLLLISIFTFTLITVYSQSKPIKIINETGHNINVTFDFDSKCYETGLMVEKNTTKVFQVKTNHYYSVRIGYYDHDKQIPNNYLRNSSIPYNSKDKDCAGVSITVHDGLINPVQDIKYIPFSESGSLEIFQNIGCEGGR